MVIVFLLLIWGPVTSHGLLSSLGLVHHHQPAGHAQVPGHHDNDVDQDHDAADGICRIENSGLQIDKILGSLLPVIALFILQGDHLSVEVSHRCSPTIPGAAPLELFACRQFDFRTALPARAPSFVS
jgi:hypothetical protein